MSKKKWLLLAAAILLLGIIGVALVCAFVLGIFIGHHEGPVNQIGLPVYTMNQTASTHAGYRRNTLTVGDAVYVNDYEEAALKIAAGELNPPIGYYGFGGKVCAIPGQPTSAYIAGEDGSEMPSYIPYRHLKQPAFDWRTASFGEMSVTTPDDHHLTTTNAALIAELVRVLRDGTPAGLPAFPFTGRDTNLTTINLACDQLPGLLFCPPVYFAANGTNYVAENFTIDWVAKPAEVQARWIPASPMLVEWLKIP